ncbi:MAG: hypothetical protein ACI4XS_00400 [Bacillus sp. (in: firmicutes)]
MTIVHILHFSIPIGSMLVIGYLLDKLSKPDPKLQEKSSCES